MNPLHIVSVSTYRPEYNPETKIYEDYNPIPRYKQGFQYQCLCNHSNHVFTKSSEFTKHFTTKMHRDYIKNYEKNTKDLTDAYERIKYLQIKLELNHQKMQRLEQELYRINKPVYSYQTELD